MRYLSPEWFAAASEALVDDPGLAGATAGLRLTLQQTVTDVPDGDGVVRWCLVVEDGVRLVPGPLDDADLRFTTNYAVAAAIATGDLGAPTAFIRGDLTVGGDLTLLTTHQRALAAVHDVLAEVRKDTVF
ncbi:MAG TPA: SCP2 sterol-binding domain-containing protein [Acidimicrobiales bacterium]|nr:SCP2 sterol-binding domain-containing protein [Acidimicrobiales bacterium]